MASRTTAFVVILKAPAHPDDTEDTIVEHRRDRAWAESMWNLAANPPPNLDGGTS